MSGSTRRVLPVVRWLQVGVATAGLGMAAFAGSAVATADGGGSSATADQSGQQTSRAHRPTTRHDSIASAAPRANRTAPARPAATGRQRAEAAAASAVRPSSAALTTASATAQATAPAPASAAPGLGSVRATIRLDLEDLFSGQAKPAVTNPDAVVTGLFQEVLRRDPTPTELQNYLRRLNISGVNGVVAGLYNSQAFRQNAVTNTYLQLLGRTPSQQELAQGVFRYNFGSAESFVASRALAGGQDFYNSSASGGGTFGAKPTAISYVDLLYRSMLGQAADENAASQLIQSIDRGLPIAMAANQFVKTDAYRTVKVEEVFQVLGQVPTDQQVADYVNSWVMSGGQPGISQSLLATAANIQRIEAGLVDMPDMQAAAVLQQLLLAPYIDGPTGFYQQYQNLVGDCSNAQSPACKNPAVFALLKKGTQRGIPNNAVQPIGITSTVTTLVPTQNEIDMTKSLYYPLITPSTLETYFAGGTVNPFGGPIITADDGTYIVDGHHRWSSIYLINPYAQLSAIDLGYVPNPQAALRQAELGVAATNGYIEGSKAGNQNLYTIPQPEFNAYVAKTLLAGDPTIVNPVEHAAAIAEVFDTFRSNLNYSKGLTYDEQIPYIQAYLWGNVLRMRDKNPFVPAAPSRAVMPQLDPALPVLNNLDSGLVSFSFPTVSALG